MPREWCTDLPWSRGTTVTPTVNGTYREAHTCPVHRWDHLFPLGHNSSHKTQIPLGIAQLSRTAFLQAEAAPSALFHVLSLAQRSIARTLQSKVVIWHIMFSLVEGSLVKIKVFPELSETLKDSILPPLNYCFSPWIMALRVLLTEQDGKRARQFKGERDSYEDRIYKSNWTAMGIFSSPLSSLKVSFSFGIFKRSWVFSGFCLGDLENTVLTSRASTVIVGHVLLKETIFFFCFHLKYSPIWAVVLLD